MEPIRRFVKAFVNWVTGHELATLLVLGLVVCAAWLFVEVADEVIEGDTDAYDRAILLAMRNPSDPADPIGPLWLEEAMRDMTALGGVAVLILLTLAVAGFLFLDRRPHTALLVLASVVSGIAMSLLLKEGFDRPRPDLVPHGSIVYTSSFPSGHSMMAAVVYVTLGVLVMPTLSRRTLKVYVLGLALGTTVLVGISRVYLGVHWPSDVLAGWTAGVGWALLCRLLANRLRRQGKVEMEPAGAQEPA